MTVTETHESGSMEIPRRTFLQWSAVAGGTAAAVGAGVKFGLAPSAQAAEAAGAGETIVWSACTVNCGSRCPLRLVVKDGAITRVLPDDTGDNTLGNQQIRACVRGRSIRQRIYSPERLKYPMKRVGKRGEGKFQQITWEEAFDTIADSLKRIIKEYGNEAVYLNYGTGTLGATINTSWPPSATLVARMMNTAGGYLNHYGDYSAAQIEQGGPYTYGGWVFGNSFDDAKHSKLQVLFGNNPQETRMSGGGQTFVTQKTKELSNVRTIVIDPRYTDTAVALADQWVPIRPGTDTALIAAMANVMIKENLHDQAFLDTYTQGFDEYTLPEGAPAGSSYKSYVMGKGPDGIEKTPEWAAPITGIPAQTIVQLAREIAQAKPCAITQGWGPQRQADGENQSRAIFTLAAMTGNVGIPGGGTGARESDYYLGTPGMPTLPNPIATAISVYSWTDAVDHGPEMTALNGGVVGAEKLTVPIKFIWQYAGNALVNQHGDINRTHALLQDESKAEMIVVIDTTMSVSARYADILLPDTTTSEKSDLVQQQGAGNMGYLIMASQAIEPLFETKSLYEMMTEVAKRMGTEQQFTEGKTYEQWLDSIYAASREVVPALPAQLDEFAKMGIYRQANPNGSFVAYADFRADPVANKLPTPSGKIEIYSQKLFEMSQTWELPEGDKITPIPEFVETWEGPLDPLREKYPLQAISHHYKARTHSSYGDSPWLKAAHPQEVWINTVDADARGIANGDMVVVFNDRGRTQLPARVSARIALGVVSVPQGAWFNGDGTSTDTAGAANVLTSWHPSPIAKGDPMHTMLVQIERA